MNRYQTEIHSFSYEPPTECMWWFNRSIDKFRSTCMKEMHYLEGAFMYNFQSGQQIWQYCPHCGRPLVYRK